MVMETKASKADGLPDLYGGMLYALLVGACAAIVSTVFLLNSGRPLIVALEDSVTLALAVALLGNIFAYVLDLRSGKSPRIIAGMVTTVILTAGIVVLKTPTEKTNPGGGPQPAASAKNGARPLP